jgi:hypothetical protein
VSPQTFVQHTNQHDSLSNKSTSRILLEGSLIVLAAMICFSPGLGKANKILFVFQLFILPYCSCQALDDVQCRRTELVHLLLMQDRLYSYMIEHTAEPKGLSMRNKPDIQSILNDVLIIEYECVRIFQVFSIE